ncbi:hypothetical protein BDR26DRAFT_808449 [Obelidium mucronatum]|nr:hypothetical protein BDR26DRAFT_808449 [Obelidium mucronatum]
MAQSHYRAIPIKLYRCQICYVIRCKLQDSLLRDVFSYTYAKQHDADGEQLFEETFSGDYAGTLQTRLSPGATPLFLILNVDGALAAKIGKNLFIPCTCDLGNIQKSYRNKLSNLMSTLLTYLPATSSIVASNKGSKFLCYYKRAAHHASLSVILDDLRPWIADGVPLQSPDSQIQQFFLCLFNFNGDYPELALTATVSPMCNAVPMPGCFIQAKHLNQCSRPCSHWRHKTTDSRDILHTLSYYC